MAKHKFPLGNLIESRPRRLNPDGSSFQPQMDEHVRDFEREKRRRRREMKGKAKPGKGWRNA